jgi:RimJ/RimL family protein N-acetyltransferase
MHRWHHAPHVARWWHEGTVTLDEVSEEYSAYIEGREPVEPYLILYEDRPIGYIQSYTVSDDEEYERLVGIENSAGVDLLIGEEGLLYKGLGPLVIRLFLEEVVFAEVGIGLCIIDPHPENTAAIKAYEKVGFEYFGSAETSEGPVYLMKLSRRQFFG